MKSIMIREMREINDPESRTLEGLKLKGTIKEELGSQN